MQGFIPEKPLHDRLGTFFIAWWMWYFLNMSFATLLGWHSFDFWQQCFLGISVCVPFTHELKHYRLINNLRHGISLVFAIIITIEKINVPGFFDFASSKTILAAGFWFGTALIAFLFSLSRLKKWYPIVVAGCLLSLFIITYNNSAITQPVTSPAVDQKTRDRWEESYPSSSSSLTTPPHPSFPSRASETISPDDALAMFYAKEAEQRVTFSKPTTPFDIIILQACSLGWEDLTEAKINPDSFFSQFDYIFTNFNSGDTYSIAAAIRLLRGACGQTTHQDLYQETSSACFPFETWRSSGYKTFTAYNHRGDYFGFDRDVTRFGRADMPIDIATLTPERTFFSNTLVYRNYDVLKLWLDAYKKDQNPLALYYNTLSLHARSYPSKSEEWKHTNIATYQSSYRDLTTDINRFFKDLSSSERRAIVVIVGEHGAALKETSLQGQTVREIPTPGVALVPAAIKLFGPEFNTATSGARIILRDEASYPALFTLINSLNSARPSELNRDSLTRLSANLPSPSDFVINNNFGTTIRMTDGFYHKEYQEKEWEKLPQSIQMPRVEFKK